MDYFKYLGGRKFILSVLAVVFVTFFIPVEPQQKLEFVTLVLGIYVTGNVATGVSSLFKK